MLNVSDIVKVQVNLSPKGASRRNFGSFLIAGGTPVIPPKERIRIYSGADSIAADFGIDAPEYLAAALWFSQAPKPTSVYIGRWVNEKSPATLACGYLSSAYGDVAFWQVIDNGSFAVSVNGASANLSGLDFSSVSNMAGVAGVISGALTGKCSVVWDDGRFLFVTSSKGAEASIGYIRSGAGGTDISAYMEGSEAEAIITAGADFESPLECVADMANLSNDWYGFQFAGPELTDEDHFSIASFIEATDTPRIYGITTRSPKVLDRADTTDIASMLKSAGLNRTFVQYSSKNFFACASAFSRAFTTNFTANNSVITLKFKQEPGVVYETLTQNEAKILKDKNCNVFVQYNNNTAIIQEGVMASGFFFDEVYGLDWLQNSIQTAIYNRLYQSKKIPQTDAGVGQLINEVEGVCDQAVGNGLLAPGVWQADGFGQISRGDYLAKGFYAYATPIAYQDQASREARIAPAIQIAVKLAGAVHFADVVIDVNR